MAFTNAETDVMPLSSGRQDEFTALFEEYAPQIHYFFLRRGFSQEDSSDLVQDTFLRAFQGLSGFRDEASIRTWLLRIAANVYKNRLRHSNQKKRSAEIVPLDAMPEGASSLSADGLSPGGPPPRGPLEETIRAERARKLWEALKTLPPRMRRTVELLIGGGFTYREIATILSVSEETVKAQLHQARKRLKTELDDYFNSGDDKE